MKTLKLAMAASLAFVMAGMALSQTSQPTSQPTSGPASRPVAVMGMLVKVDGSNLIVNSRAGRETTEVTVATNDKTEFMVDAEPGKLADLKPEMRVVITPQGGAAIKVAAWSRGRMGQVVKVEGTNLTILLRGGEASEVTIQTDAKTKVFVGEQPGTMADIKQGSFVTVLPETGTATKVIIGLARGAGGNRTRRGE